MYKLPDLPYSYDALEPFIDTKTMELHHSKHHNAYIENLNKALEECGMTSENNLEVLLQKLDKVPDFVRQKIKNNGGGHYNHSLFWKLLRKGTKDNKPNGNTYKIIEKSFTSFDKFQSEILKLALGRFGSGWVWLNYDGSKLEVTSTLNQDNPVMENKYPILGLDVWEHAYYLKYQNRRADYVTAWWNIINWDEVEKRLNEYKV